MRQHSTGSPPIFFPVGRVRWARAQTAFCGGAGPSSLSQDRGGGRGSNTRSPSVRNLTTLSFFPRVWSHELCSCLGTAHWLFSQQSPTLSSACPLPRACGAGHATPLGRHWQLLRVYLCPTASQLHLIPSTGPTDSSLASAPGRRPQALGICLPEDPPLCLQLEGHTVTSLPP